MVCARVSPRQSLQVFEEGLEGPDRERGDSEDDQLGACRLHAEPVGDEGVLPLDHNIDRDTHEERRSDVEDPVEYRESGGCDHAAPMPRGIAREAPEGGGSTGHGQHSISAATSLRHRHEPILRLMTDERRTLIFASRTVLFPFGVLPVHVFESRYVTMVSHALQDDSTFGVVLIERGSEVGGADQRFDVGSVARIVRSGKIDEARLALVTIGVVRIRITEWLDDAPYPTAMAEAFPDGPETPELESAVDTARRSVRRVMALASELGANVGNADPGLPEDPRRAAWTLCSVAPIEQLERQRLLEIEDPLPRIEELERLLHEQVESLQARLAAG